MDEVKSTYDINQSLRITTGQYLSNDAVAIWSGKEEMYGVYVKGGVDNMGELLWWLQMTSLTLDGLLEKG